MKSSRDTSLPLDLVDTEKKSNVTRLRILVHNKQSPPTNLLCSKLHSCKATFAFAVFTSITITIGVLIVYFTTPDKTRRSCQSMFSPMIRYSASTPAGTSSVAIGDFNNDNRMDIVVANPLGNNIGIFFGDGNGAFANQNVLSTGSFSSPYAVAVADFNNDNQLDIAVANRDAHNIGIFFGDGNGSFSSQRTFSTNQCRPFLIAIGDFNDDSQLDIAMVNYNTNNIGILFNFENGSFGDLATYSTGADSSPQSIAIGDLNNDTQLDIAVANNGTGNIGIFLGYGDGTFSFPLMYSFPSYTIYPCSIAIVDYNHDSVLDIVMSSYSPIYVDVLLGYGNGSFLIQMKYNLDADFIPTSITAGDFNNDFQPDIVVIDKYDGLVNVFRMNSDGSMANRTTYSTGGQLSQPQSIAISDINNDHQLDIIVTNSGTDNVGILLGYGDNTFANLITYSTSNRAHIHSVAMGDFNKDTKLDVIFTDPIGCTVSVRIGNGDGTFARETKYNTGDLSFPTKVTVSNFNNDSQLDIVVVNSGNDNIGIFLGYGNGTFTSQKTFSTGIGSVPLSIAIGDFDNDTRLDIVVANSGTDNVGVLLGRDDGTFGNLMTYSTGDGSEPQSVAVGDFNGDNHLDIVVANENAPNVVILLGLGDGTFKNLTTCFTKANSILSSIAVGDFNDDNILDVAVTDLGSDNVYVLIGLGDGTFGRQDTYYTGLESNPSSVDVADLNDDDRLDIVVTNFETNNIGVLFGYGNGRFITQISYSTGYQSKPQSVAIGDLNNDNQLDIIVANYEGLNLGVFLNIC